MSRSKWKGNFIDLNLFKIKNSKSKLKFWNRSLVVTENLIGEKVFVYNGKSHIPIKIKREKVGYKLGEFSFTRVLKKRDKIKIVKKKKKLK